MVVEEEEEEMEDNPLRVQVDRRRAEELVLHRCWTPDTIVIPPFGKARSQNAKLTLLHCYCDVDFLVLAIVIGCRGCVVPDFMLLCVAASTWWRCSSRSAVEQDLKT